jgi:sugar-specific transcriptional regulator TrmB/DNA-binding CsgD family transcriptional regulator
MQAEWVFEPVGVSELEERVYRLLLTQPGSSVSHLARLASISEGRVRSALDSLQGKGLASRSATKPPRFMPARPDLAMEVLILRRQEELERVRVSAVQLLDQFRASVQRTAASELVEIVTGREAVVQQVLALQKSAQLELLILDKPPYTTPIGQEQTQGELDHLKKGVPARVIYSREALEIPGQLEELQRLIPAGEDARLLAQVPMKMMIGDKRLGIVPLNISEPVGAGAVLVYASPLLDALATLFEALWERADPIRFTSTALGTSPTATEVPLSSADQRLLMLLAAGVKEQSIASQMGVGRRTVQRRIRRLMDTLQAQNRLQLVLQAARRGWV